MSFAVVAVAVVGAGVSMYAAHKQGEQADADRRASEAAADRAQWELDNRPEYQIDSSYAANIKDSKEALAKGEADIYSKAKASAESGLSAQEEGLARSAQQEQFNLAVQSQKAMGKRSFGDIYSSLSKDRASLGAQREAAKRQGLGQLMQAGQYMRGLRNDMTGSRTALAQQNQAKWQWEKADVHNIKFGMHSQAATGLAANAQANEAAKWNSVGQMGGSLMGAAGSMGGSAAGSGGMWTEGN